MGGQEGEEGAEEEEEKEEEEEEGEEEEQEEEEEGDALPGEQAPEGPAQAEGPRGGGQEARGEEQELGEGHLQEVHLLRGPRGHHRLEELDPRPGRQGRVGVHQEAQVEQRAQREGGGQDFRRRLHVQARGRHPEAPEVSALVVWSWISCRSYRAPAEARSDVCARGFSGDRE